MKKNIIRMVLMSYIIFPFNSMAQNYQITVPLLLVTTNMPFKLNGGCFTVITNTTRNKFKGIPSVLNKTNSIISTIHFGRMFSVRDSIYIIIGDKNENERICIIDANNNHDFSDDYRYVFNKEDISDSSNFQSQAIHFRYPYKERNIERILYMKPNFYAGGLHLGNPLAQKYFVTMILAECRIGQFNFEGKTYKAAAAMPTPRPLYDSETVFSVVKDTSQFPPSTDDLNFYKKNKNIYAGNQIFKVIRITPLGDSLYINYVRRNSEKETGYLDGYYAPDIMEKTIKGIYFHLDNYRGKYVLIDFWGTWCAPCIDMIPKISEIHKKYKNLIITSIAYENEGMDSLKKAIEKYKMNWINIYKSFKVNEPLNDFRIKSFPTTFLINPDGKIIFRGGSEKFSLLEKLLHKIYE